MQYGTRKAIVTKILAAALIPLAATPASAGWPFTRDRDRDRDRDREERDRDVPAEQKEGRKIGEVAGSVFDRVVKIKVGGHEVHGVGQTTFGEIGDRYGKLVAERKDQYRTYQAFLISQIERSQQRAEEAEKVNDQLADEITKLADQKRELGVTNNAAAQALYDAAKKSSTKKADDELAKLDEELGVNRDALANKKDTASVNAKTLKDLNDKVEDLERERKSLQSRRKALLDL